MKTLLWVILINISCAPLLAQKTVRTFIFGHSLINHELQVNPTPSQETSVPHWFHFLAEHADHQYAVSGQYGFLPQHANLPPIAQWGFDFVEGAWDSDNESFSEADFTNILLTPANFVQWQGPSENYPGDNISPVEATNTIFDWCGEQEEGLEFYIYENWPDMGGYLQNGFPPSQSEWENYNEYLNGDFHDWFLEYYSSVASNFPNSCIRMIPVGPIISTVLDRAPFDQIPITELYEDDAPHGRASTYFMASLVTYMAMYAEKTPADYMVDAIIHPILSENYNEMVDLIWDELIEFNNEEGESMVFCNPPLTSTGEGLENDLTFRFSPNPFDGQVMIEGLSSPHVLEIYSTPGNQYGTRTIGSDGGPIDLSAMPQGIYFFVLKDDSGLVRHRERIVKVK